MENKIIFKDASFFKNLLFCSCRYCIGRHTAESIGMANDIAKNAVESLDLHDRRFLAHDIRKQINDILQYYKHNMNICDYRSHITMDALTRIVGCIEKSRLDHDEVVQIDDYFFNVNQTDVVIEPYDNSISNSYDDSFFTCYTILIPWIKLANALDDDSHYIVEYKFNEEVKSEICFPIPIVSSDLKNISIKYMPVNTYLENPYIDSWIQDELINTVTPLNPYIDSWIQGELIKNVHLLNPATS